MKISPEGILAFMRESTYKPLNVEELVNALEVNEIREFIAMLRDMEQQGLIVFTRKNRYGLPEKMGLVVGRFQGHSKGFGFLIPDKPEKSDVFISADSLNG
ncbi:MAG: ribonuclease R, partial [Clostridia bacterium]|nr:ribonuclease R [Clostridia bacterium]